MCMSSAEACGIAMHSWKLKCFYKIPVDSPLIPLSEMSIILSKYPEPVTDRIVWLSKYTPFTCFTKIFASIFGGWTSEVDWINVFDSNSVVKISKKFAKESSKPLIISSDKNFLKIALFVDENSRNNCYQLVIVQDSRIRCVFQNPEAPWAQEFNSQSWVSFVFYKLPLPSSMMAISLYPFQGNQTQLYEDSDYVTFLCEHDCLTKRPDYMNNPYEETFPGLPD